MPLQNSVTLKNSQMNQHNDFNNVTKEDKLFEISSRSQSIGRSMTTLLTHTVAHSTRPSFMPKTNNQLPKKVLSLALS